MFSSAASNQTSQISGKERDETNLDYFGARYFSGSMGRFVGPDQVVMSGRHLLNPQKWNRYSYVINNPLVRMDPDGNDDFYVFRPLSDGTSAAWRAIQSTAKELGHNVKIFNGGGDDFATNENYKKALETKDAHVIFTGHIIHVGDVTAGVMTSDGGVGNPKYDDGKDRLEPVGDVTAATIALLGCDSTNLSSQYSDKGTTFLGTKPITDTTAQEAGAATFTDALVRGKTVDQAAKATQKNMEDRTEKINKTKKDEDKYDKPIVCVSIKGGQMSCYNQN